MRSRLLPTVLSALVLTTALAGCGANSQESPKTLVVATHYSWAMSKDVLAKFKAETGITVKVRPQCDAGELTNKLVLTKDSPLADGVYGPGTSRSWMVIIETKKVAMAMPCTSIGMTRA